jgi:phospholipid/cholesterol/gamma-HCH transport system substrate-binding protein
VAVALAVVVTVLLGGSPAHRLRAVFTAALQVRPGQEVRVAGRSVGSIESVALSDGRAVVTLGIDDGQWPLYVGTTAELRFGAAAAYASRFVQLEPGPTSAPALADDALLPEADTTTPVEFDQIYNTFDARTRASLGGTIAGAANTLNGHGRDLARDLELGAPGTQRTANMLGDLGLDPVALSTLVTAGAQTVGALRASDPQLQGLVSHAADTFSVFADNAAALQASIDRLPLTLSTSQHTLGHLDRSLNGLDTLVRDLAPGAAGLVTTAPLLTQTLQTLERIAPRARSTLQIGVRELPRLTRFLDTARPLLPGLSSALARLAPMVACVRPYAPEIGGYLGTWQGGPIDNVGHYGRTDIIETPVAPGTTLTPARAVAQAGGALKYAFPRPPGLNAGQLWFQPQCGAGPAALDPANDPEAGK